MLACFLLISSEIFNDHLIVKNFAIFLLGQATHLEQQIIIVVCKCVERIIKGHMMFVGVELVWVWQFILLLLVVVLQIESNVVVLNAQQNELSTLDHFSINDEIEISLQQMIESRF
jgi:hypothetical protein